MFKTLAIKAVPVVALLGVAIGGGQAHTSDEPLRCEIRTTSSGGMISLEGVVLSETEVSGSYEFRIAGSSGGGTSNIRQGGAFTAGADEEITLGRVMVGSSGDYDASLTLDADGETIDCAEETGGFL